MDLSKITDKDVVKALNGEISNELLRDYLCSKDVSSIDMSELSIGMFRNLAFDENTVFSIEQILKYNPSKILEDGKAFSSDMEKLHNKGINGEGVKVVIIDTNIKKSDFFKSKKNVEFKRNLFKAGKKEVHGATVLSSFLSVAPNARVVYIPTDKKSKNRDDDYLEYIENVVKNHSDAIAVSISASFSDSKKREKAISMLSEAGIQLIDSPRFYEDFTYSRKSIDESGKESFEETFCIEDETSMHSIYDGISKIITEMHLDGIPRKDAVAKVIENLKKSSSELERKKGLYLESNPRFAYVESIEQLLFERKNQLVKEEISEREQRESVEIPCAGRTFIGKNGKFKYFATASASYTIPQVSALFALAKQENREITFEEFVSICRETSIISSRSESGEYDRHIIDVNNLFKELLKENRNNDERYGINLYKDDVYDEVEITKNYSAVHDFSKDISREEIDK